MASREDQEYSSQAPAPYVGQFLQQGIFPYADTFLRQQFNQMGQANSSPFTYTGDRVAGFDPREQYGMQMADQAIGSYRPYLGKQAGLLDEASGMTRGALNRGQREINRGLSEGRGLTNIGAGLTEDAQFGESGRSYLEGGVPAFGESQDLTRTGAPNLELARRETAAATPQFGRARDGMSSAERSGYGSTQMYDPNSAQRYFDPYEDQVVQQTMKDVREGLSKGDMGLRDEAVSGGAFGGSRSRMRRDELAENTARGAAEQIAAIRSQGYGSAQNQAQQAFESQQGRTAGLAGLQAGLSGQEGGLAGQEGQSRLARGQQLFGMGLQGGQGLAGLGMQGAGALSGYGSQYGGMASLLPQLQQGDIQSMMGMGGMGRGRQQSLMDLNYQNFTGQYNLPMQTLQNVGALTASLGPMAGGYGYAGGSPSYASDYGPSGGMGGGTYGAGGQGAGGYGNGYGSGSGYGGYGGRYGTPPQYDPSYVAPTNPSAGKMPSPATLNNLEELRKNPQYVTNGMDINSGRGIGDNAGMQPPQNNQTQGPESLRMGPQARAVAGGDEPYNNHKNLKRAGRGGR